ncbi:MAG: extracellular solute-binding protein [Oscillospiraceae bacterium]|nr:extracellular solute-binding protein [Oscillospiraceae bacterium]
MKKNLRSLIASVLAVAMIFALAACGKSGGQSGKPGQSGEAAPAFTYVSSFREVKNEDNKPIGAACFTDTGFYTTPSEVVGQREPEEGEEKEYEGQFDIYAEQIVFVGFDGQSRKLENYVPFDFTPAEGREGYGALEKLAVDATGNLAALYHMEEYWSEAPEGMDEEDPEYWNYYHYENNWYLRLMDPTGRELSMTKLEFNPDDWFYANALLYADGWILVAGTDGLRIFSAAGGSVSKIGMDGYIQGLLRLRDGRICMAYSDYMTNESKISEIDPASGRITKTWKGPHSGYDFKSGGGDYDLYYRDGINVWGYRLDSESGEKLFDWLNQDVSSSSLSNFMVRQDGSVFAVTNTWDSKWENVTTEFVTLERKAFADAPQKKALTLACNGTDYMLENAVIRFNRNSNVRINVVDYSQYNSEEDWSAGMTKLTTEIMAGSMPDILALDGMPYQQLAAKGLLEDLYPYMAKDPEIHREDFLPNVLRALEVGGKLYSSVSNFSIWTLAGSSRVVGDKPGWSFDELRAALASMPEGCTVLDQFTTSGDILRTELTLDADYYIDWETGKVNFDSKEFIDLLHFAKLFPNAFDWDNYDWEEYTSDSERIAAGKQMLMKLQLASFGNIASDEAWFGGEMTYIGFPTASGVGSYLQLSSGYGISASCSDKEAAWQFVRGFMTEKAMEDNWIFPANSRLLEKRLQEAMTVEYQKDEYGNYLLDEEGNKMPLAIAYVYTGESEDGSNYEPVYSLTQAQADKVMALINSTDKLYMENTPALNIIFEQLDAFLSGQKSAEEVAKLVQGKMSIYVNEQR